MSCTIACFPLTVLLVNSSPTPNRAAVMLVVPLLLTKQLIGNFNFTVWLVVAAICVWQNGWLTGDGLKRPLAGEHAPEHQAPSVATV